MHEGQSGMTATVSPPPPPFEDALTHSGIRRLDFEKFPKCACRSKAAIYVHGPGQHTH